MLRTKKRAVVTLCLRSSVGFQPLASLLSAAGGDFVSINPACLDDLNPSVLAEAPVTYSDGRNNAWWNTPAETRHL